MKTKIKSTRSLSRFQKAIATAQSASADMDSEQVAEFLSEAAPLAPNLELAKLTEKAKDEAESGSPEKADCYLTMIDIELDKLRGVNTAPVDVPSTLQCAANTLDAFECEDADYYRAEFDKIEKQQAEMLEVLKWAEHKLCQLHGKEDSDWSESGMKRLGNIIAKARGGK